MGRLSCIISWIQGIQDFPFKWKNEAAESSQKKLVMEAEFRKNEQLLALKMEMCQGPRNPEKVKRKQDNSFPTWPSRRNATDNLTFTQRAQV